ncbi:hypothetical protein [uncultured Eubacterium sp.]|uniref:hypothetical protein n=1 Tax=uncultured Eubacterium sp. TaxID=165185 RepID=UPI002599FDBD|nr:hypothetical protein [uncultured Eubacterium sp.]
MWINKAKYKVENLKYRQRISYLENLICPCESHDYVEIKRDYFPNSYGGKRVILYMCKKCSKLKKDIEFD